MKVTPKKKNNHKRTPSWFVSMSANENEFIEEIETIDNSKKIFGSSVKEIMKREDHKNEIIPIVLDRKSTRLNSSH